MTIFEKTDYTDYMPIFRAGPQDTGGPWHLRKWCHKKKKKKVEKKLFLSPMATFGKCTKVINFYISPIIFIIQNKKHNYHTYCLLKWKKNCHCRFKCDSCFTLNINVLPLSKELIPKRLINILSVSSLFVNNSAITYKSGRTSRAQSNKN